MHYNPIKLKHGKAEHVLGIEDIFAILFMALRATMHNVCAWVCVPPQGG